MKNKHKTQIAAASLLCLGHILTGANAVCAQQNTMSDRAMERSRFYTAPREYQIVDERPVIRDFREAPSNGGQIGIPNGPGGGPGAGGLGNLGGGSGANATLPAGGLPLSGGNDPGYRNAPVGMGSLPKSGFGASNIPAGGMGPRGILPGVNTGVVGKVMNQAQAVRKPGVAPMRGASIKGPAVSAVSSGPPAASSYGGYSNHPTGAVNNNRTELGLRGRLLRGK